MKKQNGITLVSLIIYIAVMIIVLVIMNSVISNFYSNINGLNVNVDEIIEFNKFNIYFLKEVKLYNNSVDTIKTENGSYYVLFSSGNSFTFNSNKIYYNNIEICKNVQDANFEYGKKANEAGTEVEDKTIIKVTLSFENIEKTINYKIENIY